MATIYDGINYFPVGVNFMEENAMEVIEAKYGIKGSAIVLKLLCKIYKEGYFIHWDEEQCLIFANKAGREVQRPLRYRGSLRSSSSKGYWTETVIWQTEY